VLLETFGGGNDLVSRIYDYSLYSGLYISNDINGLIMLDALYFIIGFTAMVMLSVLILIKWEDYFE